MKDFRIDVPGYVSQAQLIKNMNKDTKAYSYSRLENNMNGDDKISIRNKKVYDLL